MIPGTEKTTGLREKYTEIFIRINNFNFLITNVKLNLRFFTRSEYYNFSFCYIYIEFPLVTITREGKKRFNALPTEPLANVINYSFKK